MASGSPLRNAVAIAVVLQRHLQHRGASVHALQRVLEVVSERPGPGDGGVAVALRRGVMVGVVSLVKR
jgi:hypothetical protein